MLRSPINASTTCFQCNYVQLFHRSDPYAWMLGQTPRHGLISLRRFNTLFPAAAAKTSHCSNFVIILILNDMASSLPVPKFENQTRVTRRQITQGSLETTAGTTAYGDGLANKDTRESDMAFG